MCAALICCVLEGGVRKWLLFNASPYVQGVVYFAKDGFLLLAALVGMRIPCRSQRLRLFRSNFLLATALLAAGMLLSLPGFRVVGGALSLRSMLVLPWLAIWIASGLRGRDDFLWILGTIGWLAVANAILGVLQFYLPGDHFLNQQIGADVIGHGAEVGGHSRIRAIGTFPFINGMGDLSVLASWAGCVLLLCRAPAWSGQVCLAAGLVCALAAMSRYGLVCSLFVIGASLVFSRKGWSLLVFWAVLLGSFFLTMGGVLQESSEDGLFQGALTRHREADSIFQRLSYGIQALKAYEETPLGEGLGITQAGQKAVEAARNQRGRYESEPARILYEIGLAGLAGIFLGRVLLLHLLWTCQARPPSAGRLLANHLCRVGFWALAVYFVVGPCFNHISSTFVCIITAVTLAGLEREVRGRPSEPRSSAVGSRGAAPQTTAIESRTDNALV
jgi:hypothetical protein